MSCTSTDPASTAPGAINRLPKVSEANILPTKGSHSDCEISSVPEQAEACTTSGGPRPQYRQNVLLTGFSGPCNGTSGGTVKNRTNRATRFDADTVKNPPMP